MLGTDAVGDTRGIPHLYLQLIMHDGRQENCIVRWCCMSVIVSDDSLSDGDDSRDARRFYDMNKRNE
jgi:hypothetical protein